MRGLLQVGIQLTTHVQIWKQDASELFITLAMDDFLIICDYQEIPLPKEQDGGQVLSYPPRKRHTTFLEPNNFSEPC
jgi:hypothetical protein